MLWRWTMFRKNIQLISNIALISYFLVACDMVIVSRPRAKDAPIDHFTDNMYSLNLGDVEGEFCKDIEIVNLKLDKEGDLGVLEINMKCRYDRKVVNVIRQKIRYKGTLTNNDNKANFTGYVVDFDTNSMDYIAIGLISEVSFEMNCSKTNENNLYSYNLNITIPDSKLAINGETNNKLFCK